MNGYMYDERKSFHGEGIRHVYGWDAVSMLSMMSCLFPIF